MARISQREARRLKKQVAELEEREEARRRAWTRGVYPGGIQLYNEKLDTSDWVFGRLQTARRLDCALVGTIDDSGMLNVYAVKW